jgi:hypothetical protein
MSAWDNDYIDEEEEGYFEFNDGGGGEFHFGYVHGQMDCRLTTRDGEPAVEWTWTATPRWTRRRAGAGPCSRATNGTA